MKRSENGKRSRQQTMQITISNYLNPLKFTTGRRRSTCITKGPVNKHTISSIVHFKDSSAQQYGVLMGIYLYMIMMNKKLIFLCF